MLMHLHIHDLTFSYHKQAIYHNANLEIDQAGIYGLIAPNGFGKTTLLDIIADNINTYAGTIDYSTSRLSYAQDIDVLYDDLTVWDHIEFILGVHKISINDPFYQKYLHLLGIETYKHKKVKACSLGMKKKLLLFLAILPNPDILLLDEPLNGLDIDSVIIIRELLASINDEHRMIVIVSTHNLPELEKLSNSAIFIQNSKLYLKENIDNMEVTYLDEYQSNLPI
ncbi:ATP-binding cassette domain-containing protein [Erysipelothrix anatis]|uniref:ATP-binding cassette domain-containing protein n=1 Tax=Erysipelothrix anatis TaxID=2683713 RepID=UPI00140A3BEA|nr:ABC transporter ATP-binding protein [Erysipelothrix anatis]